MTLLALLTATVSLRLTRAGKSRVESRVVLGVHDRTPTPQPQPQPPTRTSRP